MGQGWATRGTAGGRGLLLALATAILLLGAPAGSRAESEPAEGAATSSPASEVDAGNGAEPAADDPGNDGSNDENYDENYDEITITATKRAKSIQEVPLSVTALTGKFIEDAGLTDFKRIEQFTPNLQILPVTDTRSTSIRIRGIGSVGSNAGIDPSVGVFIDGVYQGRAGMSVQDLLDIERIEVLRGPQGTLYGKNTAAGAINVISRRPGWDPEATVEAVANGPYEGYELRGSFNVPIVDGVAATRLSGYRVARDGFDVNRFETTEFNEFNGDEVNDALKWGLKSRTLLEPRDDLDLLLTLDFSREGNTCCVADIITPDGPGLLGATFATLEASNTRGLEAPPATPFDRVVQAGVRPRNSVNVFGAALEGNWDVPFIDDHVLTSIAAYRGYRSDSVFDGDFSAFSAVRAATDAEHDQGSLEVRLASPSGERVEYVGGVYLFFMNLETEDINGFFQELADAVDPVEWPTIAAALTPSDNVNTNRHRTYNAAAFGEATVELIDELSFTGGLRFNYERKERVGSSRTIPPPVVPIDAPPIIGPDVDRDNSRTALNVSGKASVQYKPTSDVMLYAMFANGWKSGGFNQLRTLQDNDGEFDDELSLTFEIGAKTTWFRRKLTANLTYFNTYYQDFQVQSFDGQAITVFNAGEMNSQGLEGELNWLPVQEVVFGARAAFNYTEYLDFEKGEQTVEQQDAFNQSLAPIARGVTQCDPETDGADVCFNDLTGRRIDNAPQWTASFFGSYERGLFDFGFNGFVRGEYSYRSFVYLNGDLDENLRQEGYGILNLRFGLRAEDGTWELVGWVQNLTDEDYLVVAFDVPIVSGYAGINGPPRTGGVTARLRF